MSAALTDLKKQIKNRLETLGMYEAQLTALRILLFMASCGLALYSKFGGVDWYAYAIVCIPAAAFAAYVRQGVRNAIERQKVRVEEVDKLCSSAYTGGGGVLA